MSERIRVRYAPSPTGYLHIGNARTALFNYLFAKHYDGDFVVRIEDTDSKRNLEDGESSQFDNLKWLGLGGTNQSIKTKVMDLIVNQNVVISIIHLFNNYWTKIKRTNVT